MPEMSLSWFHRNIPGYNTTVPDPQGGSTSLADVEGLTSNWVGCYNQDRILLRLGPCTLLEAEADYYTHLQEATPTR